MASIAREKSGGWRVQWVDNGKRATIRIPKCPKRDAEAFKLKLERLLSCRVTGSAPDGELSRWIAALPNETHAKLARAGLVEERTSTDCTLADLWAAHIRTASVKPGTIKNHTRTGDLIAEYFDGDTLIRDITTRQLEEWRAWLVENEYSQPTVSKHVSIARQVLGVAVRWGMLDRNPAEGIRAGSQTNPHTKHYVTPEETAAIMDVCPDHDWHCIIALARWGGLRTPSETLRVRWEDVDWDRGTVRVRSPKTEHHEGHGERLIPLYPELRAVLLPAFEAAEDGAVYVVARFNGDTSHNLNPHLRRLIRRAGLIPWPKAFTAMRASRSRELFA